MRLAGQQDGIRRSQLAAPVWSTVEQPHEYSSMARKERPEDARRSPGLRPPHWQTGVLRYPSESPGCVLRDPWLRVPPWVSRSNAGGEPRSIAGATQERKLLSVGSTAMILIEAPSSTYHPGMLGVGNRNKEEEETSCDFTPNSIKRTVESISTPGQCPSAS